MNRQYSREGLLNIYQQEAKDTRDRKIAERQNRVLEERKTLDNINKQLEIEKTEKHNVKFQKMNEMREEYNKMLMRKQEETENKRKPRKDSDDLNGTFKIGTDNREIKRKTYDEISDALVINPMKDNSNTRGRMEDRTNSISMHLGNHPPKRGKSQGYNIINHYNSDNCPINPNYMQKPDVYYMNNQLNIDIPKNEKNIPPRNQLNENFENQLGQKLNNYNSNPHHINSEIDNFKVHENLLHNSNNQNNDQNRLNQIYNPHSSEKHINPEVHKYNHPETNYDNNKYIPYTQNNINNNQFSSETQPVLDEAEFQKFYQDYIKKRIAEEESKNDMNRISTPRNDNHSINNESNQQRIHVRNNEPYDQVLKDKHNSENFNSNHKELNNRNHSYTNNSVNHPENIIQNQDYNSAGLNEIQTQMDNLYINSQNQSEYNRNKMINQIGFGFNHRNIQNQNFANLENELNKKKENLSSKQRIQENYRHFLDTQVSS